MSTLIQGFRLSPQQKRAWLTQPEGSAYRAQAAWRLRGPLHPEALHRALDRLVDRHESLRTTFKRTPGIRVPLQVVEQAGRAAWETVDLGRRSRPDQEAELAARFRQTLRLPFDLDQGPALHAQLIRLSEQEHILLVRLPGLCADAQTLKNLAAQLGQAYTAACGAGPDAFDSEEAVQYVQFSEWQNELLEAEDAESGKAYWRRQDFSALAGLCLPFEAASSERAQFVPAVLEWTLEPPAVQRLADLSRQLDLPVSTLLLAVWQLLIGKLTGQLEVWVSQAFSGRKYEELQGALGLFARWLPIPARLEGDYQFAEMVKQVQNAITQAEPWQDYFAWEEQAGASDRPVECRLAFEAEIRPQAFSAGELSFVLERQYVCTERFVMKLACVQTAEALIAEFHYDSSVLSPEAAGCVADQFHTLLDAALAAPEAKIDQLPMLSEAERRRLLVEFNATGAAYPEHQCAAQLFEAQVERTPNAVAVVCGDRSLTYAELNARANGLARHLRTLGVGPEVLIGLCMERSLEMVIAIVGALKAGGAYVPLDPAYPIERLSFMMRDSGASILLTQRRLAEGLAGDLTGVQVFHLDSEEAIPAGASALNPPPITTPDHLAYVIYTSGSTGQPKGVMISHRGLVNYLTWCRQAYPLQAGTGVPVHSSISFDLTVTSLLAPLTAGQTVRLLPEEAGVEALADVLRQASDLNLIKITPAHLHWLGQHLSGREAAGRVQALVIGGEALLTDHLTFWQTHAPATALINEYGPTETVVGCCVYQAPPGATAPGAIPIGRPIINTRLYLLDSQLRPVPTGVTGELYVGGVGVGRGYLNRPELTAERFMPDPFGPQPGSRLYKTGDLARHRPDGQLEFLGRRDHQVKLRGFRIELGEIEAVLSQHPAVRQAAVITRDSISAKGNHKHARGEQLVAYMAAHQPARPSVSELRSFLAGKLPEYMVPSLFVWLPALPLTPNGKVDRAGLPAPDSSRPDLEQSYVAPRGPTEQALAEIWQAVLGFQRIGVQDDFFELGGHSLLATQVFSRIREAFEVELPLSALIETPTIAALAERIDGIRWAAEGLQAVPEGGQDGREAGEL